MRTHHASRPGSAAVPLATQHLEPPLLAPAKGVPEWVAKGAGCLGGESRQKPRPPVVEGTLDDRSWPSAFRGFETADVNRRPTGLLTRGALR